MSKREYTHISKLKEEIQGMREKGATLREIAEYFGFKDKYVVKEFLKRERRKEKELELGIIKHRKGRPRKTPISEQQELELENNRLKMENRLLRDFLYEIGRG